MNFYKKKTDSWVGFFIYGKLIRYADDFVILFARKEDAELGLKLVTAKLAELGLSLNMEKTRIVDIRDGKNGFNFLALTRWA